jgi:hypothetical protein
LRRRGEWKNAGDAAARRHGELEESTNSSEQGNFKGTGVVSEEGADSVVRSCAVSFFLDWLWEVAYYL